MRVSEIGEFGLIERIEKLVARQLPSQAVQIGIGDDAAVLRLPHASDIVVSTDAAVEGTHFHWVTHSAEGVGARAMAANLSDLAAMGAEPVAFTFALQLPPTLLVRRALGLVRGAIRLADRFQCVLVGGNIARASQTSVVITILGRVAKGTAMRRDRARCGDRIFVTGNLGKSALCWRRAERTGARIRYVPEPRVAAGAALRSMQSIGACIDISDGLSADLAHLLCASKVGARIDPARLPLPRGFLPSCRRLGLDPQDLALGGGEDYELLFTLRSKRKSRAAELARKLGVPVTEIGEICSREDGDFFEDRGWRHF